MKTSTTLVGMTITLLLLALPAGAADYTLNIFGNANGDDTIDMVDVTYTERIIMELNDETQLADAKYDGEVDILDVTQIELIILGREKELTILDSAENTVTVKKPIEKIIALTPYVAEAIRVLEAKDKIVGVDVEVTKNTRFFPDLSKKSPVGSRESPNIEQILALYPDTIITYGLTSKENLEDKLTGTDIVVVRLQFTRVESLREEIEILGYLLGERENALEYLIWYDRYVDEIIDIVSRLAEDEKPDVFLFASDMTTKTTINAAGAKDGMHELCVLAGGKNILATEQVGMVMVEAEWVLQQQEELCIEVMLGRKYAWRGYETDDASTRFGYESIEEDYSKIVGLPGFSEITAVEKNRVHLITRDTTTALALPVGLAYMAKWFYPELFEDLYPQAIHQEYLIEFQGLDYDLNEHGVFVYPPLEEI